MDINKRIRRQVISDLKSGLDNSQLHPVRRWFDGMPGMVMVDSELPGIAVSVMDGASTDSDSMNGDDWSATLMIRIFIKGDSDIDSTLDNYGQEVMNVVDVNYSASELLENCNRSGFQYGRDEMSPWGTLDLMFQINYSEEGE